MLRPAFVVGLVVFFGAPAARAQAQSAPPSPPDIRWGRDGAITGAAVVGAALASLIPVDTTTRWHTFQPLYSRPNGTEDGNDQIIRDSQGTDHFHLQQDGSDSASGFTVNSILNQDGTESYTQTDSGTKTWSSGRAPSGFDSGAEVSEPAEVVVPAAEPIVPLAELVVRPAELVVRPAGPVVPAERVVPPVEQAPVNSTVATRASAEAGSG